MIIINKLQVVFKVNYKDGSYEEILQNINNQKAYGEVLRSISDMQILLSGTNEAVLIFKINENEQIMIRSSEVRSITVNFN